MFSPTITIRCSIGVAVARVESAACAAPARDVRRSAMITAKVRSFMGSARAVHSHATIKTCDYGIGMNPFRGLLDTSGSRFRYAVRAWLIGTLPSLLIFPLIIDIVEHFRPVELPELDDTRLNTVI